ncbi:MAG: hypothetical protein COZ59_00615, partial [Bacteroidetes bacterium CG_4_8_14_3_um_filter_31_14]
MRPVTFEGAAFKEYNEWAKEDRKIFHKISELIESISRTLGCEICATFYKTFPPISFKTIDFIDAF